MVQSRAARQDGHEFLGMVSRYMHEILGLSASLEEISAEVVRRIEGIYRQDLPLMKGAVQAYVVGI